MISVKQKVKNITINKLSQSENYIDEIYCALKMLLDKNYKKYDFETSINANDIKYITDEKFQSSLFKLNEKSIEILELIKDNGILNIDEICDNTKMEVKYINAILNELVLKDLLIEMNNQVYSLNI